MTFFQLLLLFSDLNNTVNREQNHFLISIFIFVKNYKFYNKKNIDLFLTWTICVIEHYKLHHKPFLFALL